MDDKLDQLLSVASWWKGLYCTNNLTFLPLFADEHRYLVLKGGGGSGKSIFAGRKIIERAIAEKGHRFLVCRKVARTLRESCYKQLLGQLSEHYPQYGWRANKTDMSITFHNGNEILFAGLDDVEKLKSIYNITGVWIEEASELLEGDFNQLDIRLRGKTRWYQQIILSFNPISVNHWIKKRFFDRTDERATVHESTYRDNRFLDDSAKQTLEGFRETDEYYYMVYCLGQWGTTGKSIFPSKAISEWLRIAPKPVRTGQFVYSDGGNRLEDIQFFSDEDGFCKIYALPEDGVPYVIGCDTAGDGSDSFVAQVLDNCTGRQVATMRHRFDEDLFAKQVYCLGKFYNTALIGVEVNLSTYPVRELERLHYPKQYVREQMDNYTHAVKNAYGWRTDSKTRPVMIAELVKAMREDCTTVVDAVTLEEMLTFIRNENYRPEAEAGANDDCVMALAIAHAIRPQQRYTKRLAGGKKVKWDNSQWEDYRMANGEEKAYLIRIWGSPF